MINAVIREHPDDSWYVPKEERYNAWTCLVMFTLGNIELRDFELERKFMDMRSARVEEYERKWEEALERKDNEYISKYNCPGLTVGLFWSNWTQEEKDYFSNEDRFPILKERRLADPSNYKNEWDLIYCELKWYNNDGSSKRVVGIRK